MASPSRPADRSSFHIAIVCALELEANAADLLFDDIYDERQYGRAAGDVNTYTTGRVGKHAVVLLLLPSMGPLAAASGSANLRSSYPNIKLALLVGVCGGLPQIDGHEAFLGDVVVSTSIFNYDFGRQHPDGFVPKTTIEDRLGRANKDIRGLLASLGRERDLRLLQEAARINLNRLQATAEKERRRANYTAPPDADDRIFSSDYQHKHRRDCGYCDAGEHRDAIARRYGAIAFEMEGAGAWDEVPCIVVKGICDYADSHKSKLWQNFAAASAASVAVAILDRHAPREAFHTKECQNAAIFGLGGVGKTQLALQLAYWAKQHRPEYSIFWVPVLSGATFEQAYNEIAKKLRLQDVATDEDPKDSVRRYLSSEAAGPWLLIVDNADDADLLFGSPDMPSGLADYLPESEDGLVLFTTRSREVAVSVAGSDVVELFEMDPQEAADYLEKLLIRKDLLRDEGESTKLLKELTYLPLAITQAAAYLNTIQVSIAEYLKLLRGTDQDAASLMSREFHDKTRHKGSRNAVATTWLVSFDQIRKSNRAAADLLSFLSCIEPKAIPQSILPRLEVEEQTHSLALAYQYNGQVKQAVALLKQVVAIQARTLAEDHPSRLASQHELAIAYRANGQVREAVALLEQVVAIGAKTLAENHPLRLASEKWLAYLLENADLG
ncbi:hypothetical protein RB595_007648 [Gaeumannomyces hyphopodioides]